MSFEIVSAECHFCLKRWGAFKPPPDYGTNVIKCFLPGITEFKAKIPVCEKHRVELIAPGPFL